MSDKALECLRELVACKDLKDSIDDINEQWAGVDLNALNKVIAEYNHRQPLAWAAARAALSSEGGEG